MIVSSLCDYSDAYIPVKGSITVAAVPKNCAPFTDYMSKISNRQVDYARDTDVMVTMYHLMEYCGNYSKSLKSLWQYHRDESALNNTGVLLLIFWCC